MNEERDWPDLSAYGLSLVIAVLPTKKRILAAKVDPHFVVNPPLLAGETLGDRYKEELMHLGFERHVTGLWIKHSTSVSVAPFLREMPLARAIRTTLDDVTVVTKGGDDDKTKQVSRSADEVASAMSEARKIGLNRLGKEVWDGKEGRFLRDLRTDRITLEGDVKPPSPGLFLRALDGDSMATCADGLIEEVLRGRIVREDDFAAFAQVVFDGVKAGKKENERRLSDLRAAVEAAATRFLARRGRRLRDVFNGACRLQESLTFLQTDPADTSGVPLPVAVAMQRVVGTDSDLAGRKVLVPFAGVGKLLSHLPGSVEIVAAESSEILRRHLKATVRAVGARATIADESEPRGGVDYKDCDVVIAAPSRAKGARVEAGGVKYSRHDVAQMVAVLAGRLADGRAVIALDGPADAQEDQELVRFQEWVGRHFVIEGTAEIDGPLHAGRPDARAMRVMVVGRKLPEALPQAPEEALALKEVRDFGGLWTWTAEVVSNRHKIESRMLGRDQAQLSGADPDMKQNEYQAPYVSASAIGTPTTMVPRPLEGASREALSRVVRLHGDVDVWVAAELGYATEDLGKHFSPEQIDALALKIHAEDRRRGFLNADQTGVGKGRWIAGVMRRGALRKKKIVFFTEKPINLSDIWRDILHTGSEGYFTPMIVNDGVDIIDERDGSVVMKSAKKGEISAMLRDRKWPEGVNLVMQTYGQINREATPREPGDAATWRPKPGDKARWLLDVVDEDTILVLDEAHNAAGDSNISKTIAKAVEQAGDVVYSSATFAKNARSMAFYTKLLPDGMSAAELTDILLRGGETMQEVFSTMLVQDGVMVRREHDLSKVEFVSLPDTQRMERNRAYMDALAPVLAEMAFLSGDVDKRLGAINQAAIDAAQRQAGDAPGGRDNIKALNMTRVGFGSPLYTLSRLFVAALKADISIDQALTALRNNEKPVILVENTIQGFLEELAERDGDMEGSQFPDFRGLVHRALTRMTSAIRRNIDGGVVRVDLTERDAALKAQVDRIRALIDRLPALPVSAIDVVKERINAEGFVCDEITGRHLEVSGGKIMRRRSADKTRIKNAFNSGEIDALVVNNAGCTGIDLHAGVRFADQRKRVMIELQEPADILRQIQAYGRVNRYDQVVGPRIEALQSGLPIEMRLHAMRNAKLRRLSANVSSNRDNAALIRDIPDLINPVGDMVCSRYADARPELMRRLGFDIDRNAAVEEQNLLSVNGDTIDSKRSANELLARLIMLPVALQEQVANELTAEYYATMEELEAKGETPLKTKEMAGTVHVHKTAIFEGAEVENPDSVFHEPLYSMTVAVSRKVEPMRREDVIYAVEMGLSAASGARGEALSDYLLAHREDILASYLPDTVATVADGLATGNKTLSKHNKRLEALAAALREVRPGREMSFTSLGEGEVVKAIITSVHHAQTGFEHVASMHSVEFVRPGDTSPSFMKFKTLIEDEAFQVEAGLEGSEYDAIMQKFEDAVVSKVDSATLLTGNIFRGMRHAVTKGLGTLVTYEKDDGTKHRGILVAKRFRNMDMLPVELDGADMAFAAFSQDEADLRSSQDLAKSGISFTRTKSGVCQVELPSPSSRRYGFVHQHPFVQDLVRRTDGKFPAKILLGAEEVRAVIVALHQAGVKFWCSGKHRPWSLKYLAAGAPAAEAEVPMLGGRAA